MSDAFVGYAPIVQTLLAQLGLADTPVYSVELSINWRRAHAGQVLVTCTVVTASEGCDLRAEYKSFRRSPQGEAVEYEQAKDAPVLRCERLVSREQGVALMTALDCHQMREVYGVTVRVAQNSIAVLETRHNACKDQVTRLLPLLAACDLRVQPVVSGAKERA